MEACAVAPPPPCEMDAAALEPGESDEMWTSVGKEEELKQDVVSKREPHGCPQCGKSFKLLGRSFLCHVCCKMFLTSQDNLTQHLSVHTGEKPYVCPTCGKACARKVYLSAHVRTHSGERPYTCAVCHCSFSQSHSLKTHMRSHQGAPSSSDGKNL
uniref:C2H2-type domain-containing protein n=1 Tax=Gouania willdenowi TaxID=441366 RepID=A0A8C5HKE9_GOUWI